jgi:outer membrane protein assembly factor BamB
MGRRTRVTLALLGLAAAIATGLLLIPRRPPPAARTPLPATTQSADPRAATHWTVRTPRDSGGFGLIRPGTWYLSEQQSTKPTVASSPIAGSASVLIGDVRSGRVRATLSAGQPITGPTLRSGPLLFAPTGPTGVTAIDLDTRQTVWQADATAPVTGLALTAPATAHDSTLIVGTTAGVRAYHPGTGTPRWARATPAITATALPATPLSASAPGADRDFVCFATDDRTLHVWDARTGDPRHAVKLDILPRGAVTVHNAIAYVAGDPVQKSSTGFPLYAADVEKSSAGFPLYAVDLRTGHVRWKINPDDLPSPNDGGSVNGPVVADGVVYFAFAPWLCAADAKTGRQLWRWERPADAAEPDRPWRRRSLQLLRRPLIGPPLIRGGVAYVTSRQSVYALDAATGREVWHTRLDDDGLPGGQSDRPPIFHDGLLYCPLGGGRVAALRTGLEHARPAPPAVTPAAVSFLPALLIAAFAVATLLAVAAALGRRRAAVAVLSLALAVAVARTWVVSYDRVDFVGRRTLTNSGPHTGESKRGLTSHRGALTFGADHAVWHTATPRPIPGGPDRHWWWLRLPHPDPVADAPDLPPADLGLTRFAWTRTTRPSGTPLGPQSETSLAVPHWTLLTLCALPPFAWLTGLWRDRPRHPKGHCPTCGYDLRATPTGPCPECGHHPSHPHPPAP